MKKIIFVLALLLVTFAFLSADVYVKMETRKNAFMDQPAQNFFQEHWLAENKMIAKSNTNDTILNLDQEKLYWVNHGSKSYVAGDLPANLGKIMPIGYEQIIKQMIEGMTLSVQPNGQTKKILEWNADGYDVTMTVMGQQIEITLWTGKDVPFDWKSYSKLSQEMLKAQFRISEKFTGELNKIQGYILATEIRMVGLEVTSTVIGIDPDRTPETDIYAPPAGYTQKERLSPEDIQQ